MNTVAWVSTCATGKRGYYTRSDAKTVRNRHGSTGMNAYRCVVCEMWHVGHLPIDVRRGEITRDEIKPPAVVVGEVE